MNTIRRCFRSFACRGLALAVLGACALAVGNATAAEGSFLVRAESSLFSLDTRPQPAGSGTAAEGSFVVRVESPWFTLDTRSLRPASQVESGLFTIDTRAKGSGGITGKVFGGGLPLVGATVVASPGGYTTSSGLDGRFLIPNVPSGWGYAVDISASGYGSSGVSGLRVDTGTTELGELILSPLSGNLRLGRLDPEVNPAESTVEEGGVAYRYYRLSSSSYARPGGTQIALRRDDGTPVPQADDGGRDWAGRVPGVVDADGIVRLALPCSFIGTRAGDRAGFTVLLGDQEADRFTARLTERTNQRRWRHEVGGGVSGKVAAVKVGVRPAFETEIEQQVVGGRVTQELITRRREFELTSGADLGAGVKFGAGASAHASAEGFGAMDLFTTYRMAPDAASEAENAMKLYLALGDTLTLVPFPLGSVYDYCRQQIEPQFLDSRLVESGGELRLGGRLNGDAFVGAKAASDVEIGAFADLSGEVAGLFGWQRTYGDAPGSQFTLGFYRQGSASVSVGAKLGPNRSSSSKGAADLDFTLFDVAAEMRYQGRLKIPSGVIKPARVEIEQKAVLHAGVPVGSAGWVAYLDPTLQAEARRELSETIGFNLPGQGAFSELGLAEPLWGLASSGGGPGLVLRADTPAALLGSVLGAAFNAGTTVDYERSIYGGKGRELEFGIEVDLGILGLGIGVEGAIERGASVVNERGRLWRYKRMPLESYPPLSLGELPSQSTLDLEAGWALQASRTFRAALNEAIQKIADAGETIIEIGSGASKAVIRFAKGVMDGGTDLITRWVSGGLGGRRLALASARRAGDAYLPPTGAGNYRYGVSGVFQIETTNTLRSAVTITLSYTEADAAGLVETNLSVFRLDSSTQRWTRVGGVVDTNAHQVTATVTNLGTFALAPPLPTGALVLMKGGDRLPADGKATMTITLTNLVLNTGQAAVEPWLYAVSASGLEILDRDARPELPGVQIVATNAALTVTVRASLGGAEGRVGVASVAGDAAGETTVSLVDDTPPAPPPAVPQVIPGQSRLMVSWPASPDTDVAGYRVRYRVGQAGPPWDGAAAVEGSPSPVWTATTNVVLRGLELGAVYHVAVTAVDAAGNESQTNVAPGVMTIAGPPSPPHALILRVDGTNSNTLTWTRSEDDGFNDRDVVRYEVWRAERPGGLWTKVRELPAGSEVYVEPAVAVSAGKYIRFAVSSVDRDGLSSVMAYSSRFMADGVSVDNDGDGMPDDWERAHGLNPDDPADALADSDGDGVNNLNEYLAGTDPSPAPLRFQSAALLADGRFKAVLSGVAGRSYRVEVSTNLIDWGALTNFPSGGPAMEIIESVSTSDRARYYRAVSPGAP